MKSSPWWSGSRSAYLARATACPRRAQPRDSADLVLLSLKKLLSRNDEHAAAPERRRRMDDRVDPRRPTVNGTQNRRKDLDPPKQGRRVRRGRSRAQPGGQKHIPASSPASLSSPTRASDRLPAVFLRNSATRRHRTESISVPSRARVMGSYIWGPFLTNRRGTPGATLVSAQRPSTRRRARPTKRRPSPGRDGRRFGDLQWRCRESKPGSFVASSGLSERSSLCSTRPTVHVSEMV